MRLLVLALCLILTLTPGHVRRVVDGDTWIAYHVGVPPEERIRVLGVDTPERGEPGYDEARLLTGAWLAVDTFTVRACRRDSFGRLLADVSRNFRMLSDTLIAAGYGIRVPRNP